VLLQNSSPPASCNKHILILLLIASLASAQDIVCVSTSNATFTNITCPNGTYCVYDNRYDQYNLAVQPIVTQTVGGLPIGCCPNALSTPCYPGHPYNGIMGCCPPFSFCCMDNNPYLNHWIGCADDLEQCCGSQICGKGYVCCDPIHGTCCPKLLRCANETEMFRHFVDTNSTDIPCCLEPYNLTYSGANVTFCNITTTPEGGISVDCNLTQANISNPNVFNETYPCGCGRCYTNDTCVLGYSNLTFVVAVDVPPGTPHTFTYYPDGTNLTVFTSENSTEIGCCPNNTTPCSNDVLGFGPYPAEHNFNLQMTRLLGCAKPGEECCAPYICPVDMTCCRARSSFHGNLSSLITASNYSFTQNLTLLDMIAFQQICCPTNTSTCCVVETPSIFTNTDLGVVPYCGKGDSCDEPMFGLDSRLGLTLPIVGYPAVQISLEDYVDGLLARTNVESSRFGCVFDPASVGTTCGFCEEQSAFPITCVNSPTPPFMK